MESEISFKIKAFTEPNQSIKLLGSIPELGQWSPNQALPLYTTERDYSIWSNLHLLRIPCGQKFEFKFAVFENNTLKYWESLPGNCNRKYSSRYARVSLVGTFGDIAGKEIIEKKYPSFSNIEIQINEESIRKLRIGINWDPLKYADNSESDDNSSFTEFFVTNSHSISDTVNNSEEDGLSDIVDSPEAALVIKPSKTLNSDQSSSSEVEKRNEKGQNFKTSPKKMIKRNNHPLNKRPIIDKSGVSSLQRYFMRSKQENRLFNHYENDKSMIKTHDSTRIHGKLLVQPFKKQNILIISLYLPIRVKLLPAKNTEEGSNNWEVTIESRDFASNLLRNLLDSKLKFYFLGILRTFDSIPFDKYEQLRTYLKENYHCIPIFYDQSDINKLKQEFFLNYFDFSLSFNLPRNSSKLFNYDEQLYLHCYKGQLLKTFNNELQHLCQYHSNPFIYVIDYTLFGLPSMIKNTLGDGQAVIFYWGLSFLNSENFAVLPFGSELMNSIMSCEFLIFNTFQEAKSFFAILKEKNGLDFSSNSGILFFYNMAKSVGIRFSSGLLDNELLKQNHAFTNSERLWKLYWKEGLKGYELIVSIDDSDRNISLLLLKFYLIEVLASEIMKMQSQNQDTKINLNIKKIKFLEIYSSVTNLQISLIQAKKSMRDINERLGYECIYIIEGDVPENIENSLLSRTKFLLETQVFETTVCKIQRFLYLTNNSGIILIPASFESWISTQTQNFLSFHYFNPKDFVSRVLLLLQDQNSTYPSQKTERQLKNENPFLWLEGAYQDLTLSSNFPPSEAVFPSLPPKNSYSEPVSIPYERIPLKSLAKSFSRSKNGLIILGHEEVLIPKDAFTYIKDDFDQAVRKILKKPSDSLIEALQKLSSFPSKLTVYIITGRGLDLLGYWHMELENIGFANEYGFLNKDPCSRVWHRLFEMDWNWKDIVKKIMENYTMKTAGSSLEMKEACVVWKYDHSDYEMGIRQSNALIGHLNEVFENNSEIDVIKYERAVEVRPLGLNKGTLIQMLTEKIYKERGKIDFVMCVGGLISDEDMFNGLEELKRKKKEYFADSFEMVKCMTGKKPSTADCWIDGTDELIKILRTLTNE